MTRGRAWLAMAGAVVSLLGCSVVGPEMAASPGPTPPAQPQRLADAGAAEPPPPMLADASAPVAADDAVVDAAPPTAADPTLVVSFEQPYKLGARPDPSSPEHWKRYIAELRAWNDGGVGPLRSPMPPPEGHPDPRVVIDVSKASGGLDANAVQRVARQAHWGNVVRCYRLGYFRDPQLHGTTQGSLGIGKRGNVRSTKLRKSELGDRDVARCLVEKLSELTFPAAKAPTNAQLSIRVSPGDDPLPPPEDELVAGPGELTVEQMLAGAELGREAFEGCYRAALSYAPELWGRVPIRFHVTSSGLVDEAFDDGGRLPDPRLRQCLLRAARTLRFPAPRGGELRFVVPVRLATDRTPSPVVP